MCCLTFLRTSSFHLRFSDLLRIPGSVLLVYLNVKNSFKLVEDVDIKKYHIMSFGFITNTFVK
jgi:hypothetical protein